VTGYTFFIEYGLNLCVKINRRLAGTKNKKGDDANDGHKNENYLLGKEIHQQLLGDKVTIIQVLIKKEIQRKR